MTRISCGIDFGTSNSSVGLARGNDIHLVAVEDAHVTIPSAVFYARKEYNPYAGRAAMKMFFDQREGRLMRSLKRVLGTSLMKQGTAVNGKVMKFENIIASFLIRLKEKTDTTAGVPVDSVTMGRPVHFVDHDPAADLRAQDELKNIARSVGFKNIEFQYEPIAAAFAHEVKVSGEKLALVADLGGGTSDFTVIRLSAKSVHKPDRTKDILANTGVRVGGNDFDKALSLSSIMPELGYKTTYGEKHLEVPMKPFHDLAEWSKVNFLYTTKTISQTRQMLFQSHDKKRFGRLLNVLEKETGHTLLATAEDTKIALTAEYIHQAPFHFLEDGFTVGITREQFESSINNEVDNICHAATQCVRDAGVKYGDIDLVILTGGSTELPIIQTRFKALFPSAAIADEFKLSSVGLGLAYDSRARFGE